MANAEPSQHTPEDFLEEQQALARIVRAFQTYQHFAQLDLTRWRRHFNRLPRHHQAAAAHLPLKFDRVQQCILANHFFLTCLLDAFDPENNPYAPPHLQHNATPPPNPLQVPPGDVDKVRYVLKNVMRDWSAEGAQERSQSYGRIINELKIRMAPRVAAGTRPQVLIPGTGLGRLCVEVAACGFAAEGNEYSYFMLMAASFMLNHTNAVGEWSIHPWIHTNSNHVCDAHQLRPVRVPDVLPSGIVAPGMLSMCAGEFVEVYAAARHKECFDCVVTCFFIDTAHNIIEYLETIHHVLRPGGMWINLGPLLYHWSDAHTYLPADEMSIELSLEDILRIATTMGFATLQYSLVPACYIADMQSMYKTTYTAAFFTMEKSVPRQAPNPAAAAIALPNGAIPPTINPLAAIPNFQTPGSSAAVAVATPAAAAAAVSNTAVVTGATAVVSAAPAAFTATQTAVIGNAVPAAIAAVSAAADGGGGGGHAATTSSPVLAAATSPLPPIRDMPSAAAQPQEQSQE